MSARTVGRVSHPATTTLLSDTDLPSPAGDRWFEDYRPGAVYEFGHVSLTEQQIVDFARLYDPQSIHDDPEWARTGPFEGLIASGIQTIAVTMRMYVDHYVSRVASLASPGLDELRWPRPVRPGDPAAPPGRGGRVAAVPQPARPWPRALGGLLPEPGGRDGALLHGDELLRGPPGRLISPPDPAARRTPRAGRLLP